MNKLEAEIRARVQVDIGLSVPVITHPLRRTIHDIAGSILRRNPQIKSSQLTREDMEGNRCHHGEVLVFIPSATVKFGDRVKATVWKRKGKEVKQ